MPATTDRVALPDHRYMSATIGLRKIGKKIGKKIGEKIGERKMALALAAVLTVLGIIGHAQSGASAGEISMTAKKYEFTPNIVTVRKGDKVRLVITALDHEHGFRIEAFHIDQKLPKGSPVTVEFVADQAGTFPFQCSQFCGLGHKNMKGSLVVE
jgi:cytochrome c oxidase subunit 2